MNTKLLLPIVIFASLSWATVSAQDAAVATPLREAQQARFSLPETDDDLEGSGPFRRQPWFQNVWRERRTMFTHNAEHSNGAVVFLGDSITQGWGDDFKGDFASVKKANRGISGDTTRGMLYRLEEDVLELNPVGVVILAGTNDLEEGATPETIASNMRLIVAKIRERHQSIPIVLCQVFPSSESKRRPSVMIKKLNELYQSIAREERNITILDTWTLFADEKGDAKPEEFPDLLHPNKAGYQKWALALQPIFATLGFVETEEEPFEVEPGFELLFNGKDLTGWGYRATPEAKRKGIVRAAANPNSPVWVIVPEGVSFEEQAETPDGRYVAKNGRLVVTTPREGRKIQQLWSTKSFDGDFELRLEFRATPNADSGVFIREPQLQCRDYVLAGPYKELKSYKPQLWNTMTVIVKEGVAHCKCNDEVIESAMNVPASGPIGLEGDRGQIEYRRIRIKKL